MANEERPNGKNRSFFTHLLERGGIRLSAPNKQRQKLMRKFRKLKKLPSDADTERFSPAPEEGLSEEQVERRFNEFLFNDVNKRYSKSYASIFIGNICTFFNLLCVLVAAALIFARADITQFLFVVIFSANLLIGIVQEILAKKQIDKLAVLLSSTVKVVRGGKESEIPVKEVVLDDVLCLEAGQQVPADCILLDGNAEVNEALLTGESDSVKKREGEMLYAGSFVVSGACRVRADKVGAATYLNKLTSKAKKYKRPSSEIMNSIRLFIRAIALLIVIVAGLMTWTNWKNIGAEDNPIEETIQRTGAVVIGMIPSGLLLLTSLAMAVGVQRLGKTQHIGFCCRVDVEFRARHEGRDGGDIEDVAFLRLLHLTRKFKCELCEHAHIEINHPERLFGFCGKRHTIVTEARVVDEHFRHDIEFL